MAIMGKSLEMRFDDKMTAGMKTYFKKVGIGRITSGADKKAKTAIGLQLINFVINGSSNAGVVPPILHGVLRASASVFVGSEFVGGNNLWPVTEGAATPNTSYSANDNTVTVGFNTIYATRMHETDWLPGPVSEQSGDTGNKFVEKHLKSDGKVLIGLYSDILKKESGG